MKSQRKPFTGEGFKKVKIPTKLYKKLLVWYLQNEDKALIEASLDPSVKQYIRNAYKPGLNTKVSHLNSDKKLLTEFNDTMHQMCSEWSNQDDLVHTSTYGIRIYEDGDILQSHTDRPKTHIISAICSIYQEDMREPWGLQIKDHNGWWHEVFLEPGEMVFYESDILEHGRMYPLKGKSYANIFVHFKPENYDCGCDGSPLKPQVKLDENSFVGFHNATNYNLVSQPQYKNDANDVEVHKGVLSKTECKKLIKEYTNFQQARTHAGNVEYDKEYRKAENAVYEKESEILQKIRGIIAEYTNTHVDQQERPISIIKYEKGGEYKPHHDYYSDLRQARDQSMGNRWKTAILYLNDDYEGGETQFPTLDITIKGNSGDLLTWTNLNKNGTPNTDTLHSGLPVKKGTKYIVVSWIRERVNQPQYMKI